MFNEKSTKKSNKAITITDTIKDIMTKNSPVSSLLEIKSDENTSVTNFVTNNDTIMDVEEENTEILNSNQDGTDNDSEFRSEASKNYAVSSNIFLPIIFMKVEFLTLDWQSQNTYLKKNFYRIILIPGHCG